MKRFLTVLCGLLLVATAVAEAQTTDTKPKGSLVKIDEILKAEMVVVPYQNEVVVKKSSSAAAKLFFRKYTYDYAKTNARIPSIFFQRLPYDWDTSPENASKHRTFIRILLPLVLKVNDEILSEREEVMRLYKKIRKNGFLHEEEYEWVNRMAAKYDAFTTHKGDATRAKVLLRHLMDKVDAIPPSIMISTAIIYSNWGTSRLAIENNSLYKEEVWYTNQGVMPKDDPGADYRYRSFPTLEECIKERALHINSSIDYDYFRHNRLYQRQMQQMPNGTSMAAQMMHDSNLQNIGGVVDYTLSFYKLEYTDQNPQLAPFHLKN